MRVVLTMPVRGDLVRQLLTFRCVVAECSSEVVLEYAEAAPGRQVDSRRQRERFD
jgi:hypothetical protein